MAVRSIFSRGEPFPNVALKRTFRLHTQYDATKPQGGVDWGQHNHQRFPWLHTTVSVSGAIDPNKLYLKQQTANGYRDVEVRAQPYSRHLYINNEDSSILTKGQIAELNAAYPTANIPDLMYNTPQNTRKIDAIRKPAVLDDVLLNNMDAYRILASNPGDNTITVTGQNWYANRKSTIQKTGGGSLYSHDAYQGINSYMRDGLTSDAQVLYSRNKQYPYMMVEVSGGNYKVDKITDIVTSPISSDNDLGIILGGLPFASTVVVEVRQINSSNEYSDSITANRTLSSGETGTTTAFNYTDTVGTASVIGQAPPTRGVGTLDPPTDLRLYPVSRTVCNIIFRKASANTSYELVVNGVVVAHMLSERSMLTSSDQNSFPNKYTAQTIHILRYLDSGAFIGPELVDPGNSIYYGYVTVFRRPQWLTTMAGTTGDFHQKDGVWRIRARVTKHALQFVSAFLWGGQSEVNGDKYQSEDKEDEYDIFEYPACTSVFHNMHKPTGGMYNYAQIHGETPVMYHPEWTNDTNIQHQVLIYEGHEHYVDPTVEIDILYAIWPEGNEAKKPGNRVEVYVRTSDGEWRFTGGAITSTAARNGKVDKLCAFLCNPVDGNFVASMTEIFSPDRAATENGDTITFEIMDFEAYQFVGSEAGGSSLPETLTGLYPQPMLPTPCQFPEASGTGIITEGLYNLFSSDTVTPDPDPDPDPDPGTVASGTGARISTPGGDGDVILPRGVVNKSAIDESYKPIIARKDGTKIYIRNARLES